MEGVFSKCQDCGIKPATIKFTNHNIEKKVCYNCQKKLESDPSQREWKKEIIPYAELRKDNKLDQSRSQDYGKSDSFFKSPEQDKTRLATSSILKQSKDDRSGESANKFASRTQYSNNKRLSVTGNETISPKASYLGAEVGEKNTRSYSVTTLPNELISNSKSNTWNSTQPLAQSIQQTHVGGAIRHGTPKKKIFFSEYLKDFEPTINTYKSPFRTSAKDTKDINGRASVDDVKSKLVSPENNSFREFDVKADNYGSNKYDTLDRPSEKTDSFRNKPSQTPERRESIKSVAGSTQDDINRKLKELRKEEIRAKINKLSEKLYSPGKIIENVGHREDLVTSFESPRGFKKETSFGANDTSYLATKIDDHEDKIGKNHSDLLNVSNISRIDPQKNNESQLLNTSNISRLDQQNIEIKYKIIIQENENTIFSLKNHIQNLEKKNSDMLNKLKDELREARETQYKDKADANARSQNEIKNLNERVRELERNWKDEVSKSKSQQEYHDQEVEQLERKITDLRQELDNTRQERDNKITDLNNQLRQLQKSQRESLSKVRAESEQAISKVQEENALLLKDTTTQLEKKNNEIERLKKEKSELIQYNNDKLTIFQDKIKNLQELNDKLNQTIDLKNEEIKKLNRKVNEAKTEFTIIRNEVDLFDQEKDRLKDENERLKAKLSKLEKLVYGTSNSPFKA